MKLKIKPAYIGLFLIAIMFFSTFAFTALQAVYYNPAQSRIQLPTGNIATTRLAVDQENFLLSQGKTLMIYQYSLSCERCLQQRQILEQLATSSKLSSSLFLEVLTHDELSPKLTLMSYYGQLELANVTDGQIVPALCQVLVDKPVECALQQIQ